MVQVKLTADLFAAMFILPFAIIGAPAHNFYDREDLDSSHVRRAWLTRYDVSGCTIWHHPMPDPCHLWANCGCTGVGLFSCHDQVKVKNCKHTRGCGCVALIPP
ncbi:uncharacterized protein LACBIDRAFT_300202 [Laccaria bicolor S238N-H82]|uniref:Predicted protein n=1 Tax=Laccaria bicolor (strain S238N-H82 / ATCC MYA-4686) TaxID=486041 RepID=B0DGA1_LACBS|nr:uncharacterized protein LACBIDRAFT_300202 [Laccaria bicolor S238N-H82]EDR06480.1 predicted protein [Laccaria bicolor S238N-H82]|eukprot:XP_001882852.1 predicted protein [Laccaria bicolor S238N-H82]